MEFNFKARAMLVGGLYFCFGAMERATWPNLLPTVASDFGVSSAAIAWTIIAFALGMAGSTLTAGRLGDILGHKRLAAWGFAIEGLILAAIAFMPVLWPIFLLRFLQGFAAAAALNNVSAIVFGAYSREYRGRVIGIVSGLASIGLLLGPLYSGFIGQSLSWRWAIIGIAIYVLAQSLITIFLITNEYQTRAQGTLRDLNWSGAVGFLLSMVGLIISVQLLRSASLRWLGVTLFIIAIGAVFATIRSERLAKLPILGLNLFRSWNFSSASASIICFSVAFGAMNLLFPFYLQNGLGWTIAASGVILVALNVVQPFCSPVSGYLADRIGPLPVIFSGWAIAIISLVLSTRLGDSPTHFEVIIPLLIFGLSASLFMPASTKLIYADVPQTALASAAAMATSGRYIGQSLGAALGTALLITQGDSNITTSFGTALMITAVLLTISMVLMIVARPVFALIKGKRA